MTLISYQLNQTISVTTFQGLLYRSTLADRRPVDNTECIQGMLQNTNLMISAWCKGELIGIARCVTDFYYCCYLSDLAVDQRFQKKGVGKKLQEKVLAQLNPSCKLILIAAPKANTYYRQLGYEHNERCWVLDADRRIKTT